MSSGTHGDNVAWKQLEKMSVHFAASLSEAVAV
jgi:hypothetical protein